MLAEALLRQGDLDKCKAQLFAQIKQSPGNMRLKNNAQFIVFFPVRYPITDATSDQQKLAKVCEWSTPSADFYIGQGQRVLLSDESEFLLLNIQTIEFD